MNKDYTKLKDFAQKRLDDSCRNGNDDDVRYWVGYIDGLNALHKKLCGSEEALEKQIPKQPKYEDVDNVYGAIKRTCTACGDVCMVSKGAKPYEHYCRQCGQALDWSENND